MIRALVLLALLCSTATADKPTVFVFDTSAFPSSHLFEFKNNGVEVFSIDAHCRPSFPYGMNVWTFAMVMQAIAWSAEYYQPVPLRCAP